MIDRYTKFVLTVIAIRGPMSIGQAIAMGRGCGSYSDPCIVE